MERMIPILLILVFIQISISHQQMIMPEHKRRHCTALRTSDILEQAMPEVRRIIDAETDKIRRQYSDIMEQAMPEVRRIIDAETDKIRRQYEAKFATLRGGILLICEAGWVYYDDNCYLFLMATLRTWDDTREICQASGAYLAEIRNEEENNFIKSEAKKLNEGEVPSLRRSYFLGGTDGGNEGVWKWVRTGERIRFSDWTTVPVTNPFHEGSRRCTGAVLLWFGYVSFTANIQRTVTQLHKEFKTRVWF